MTKGTKVLLLFSELPFRSEPLISAYMNMKAVSMATRGKSPRFKWQEHVSALLSPGLPGRSAYTEHPRNTHMTAPFAVNWRLDTKIHDVTSLSFSDEERKKACKKTILRFNNQGKKKKLCAITTNQGNRAQCILKKKHTQFIHVHSFFL